MADSKDLSALTSWDADFKGLRAVVLGLGVSGFAAADTLAELGARVVVLDSQDSPSNRDKAETLKIVGVESVQLGEGAMDALPGFPVGGEEDAAAELIIPSPGIPPHHPLLAAAEAAGIAIWSEVELAWRLNRREGREPAQWLAITGTNGKTTTVQMTESILLAAGKRAIAAGNVGIPVLDVVRDPIGYEVIAVELSSFQLHYTHTMEPEASVVLNLAQDHVDWHGGFQGYHDAKAKIYERTRIAAVYNAADEATLKMVENADVIEGARAIGFTTDTPYMSMVGVVENLLVDRAFVEDRRNSAQELASFQDIAELTPMHVIQDALAASALCRAIGIPAEKIREGLQQFQAGAHRIEPVGALNQVLFVNDSKATNPHAAAASLGAFKDVVWIAGGLSKGVEYTELVAEVKDRLRGVVVIGTDVAPLLSALESEAPEVAVVVPEAAAGAKPADPAQAAAHADLVMDTAVRTAYEMAQPQDAVLMAPAAASMDQFSNYAHRGTAFAQAVARLIEEKAETIKDLSGE